MRPQNVGHTACPANEPEPKALAQTQAEAVNRDTGAALVPTSSGGVVGCGVEGARGAGSDCTSQITGKTRPEG